MAEHDQGHKLLFSHPEVVRDLVLGFVRQDWVRRLDFDTLEQVSCAFITESLGKRDGDALWRVRFEDQWLYVYLLLEFQSTIDRFMALRMLTYVVLLYQNLLRNDALDDHKPLPPVLPILLYNGERPWNAGVEMKDLVARVQGLDNYTPGFRFLLLDEKRLEALDPSVRNLAGALFNFERAKTTDDILQEVRRLRRWLDGPGQEGLRRSFTIWLCRVLSTTRGEPVDVSELTEVESMLVERAKEWVEQWKREGLEQGLEQGLERGREEGLRLGEVEILLRLLTLKFGGLPEKITALVTAAGIDELHTWSERLLCAETLDEVFRD